MEQALGNEAAPSRVRCLWALANELVQSQLTEAGALGGTLLAAEASAS